MNFSRAGWKTISDSFIAGTCFSFPISWAVCSLAPPWLSGPISNALLGICFSFLTYTIAFAFVSKRSIDSVVYGLAAKTTLEMTLRGLIHCGMMYGGIAAVWASLVAQLTSGFIGHLSVTSFVGKNKQC